jgi:hypothetical protein
MSSWELPCCISARKWICLTFRRMHLTRVKWCFLIVLFIKQHVIQIDPVIWVTCYNPAIPAPPHFPDSDELIIMSSYEQVYRYPPSPPKYVTPGDSAIKFLISRHSQNLIDAGLSVLLAA